MELYLQLLAAAAVVALAVVLTRRLTRLRSAFSAGRARRARWMDSVERLPLTPQHTLHLVRVRDRAVLVAAHSRGCQLLGSWPWEPEGGAGSPEGPPEER